MRVKAAIWREGRFGGEEEWKERKEVGLIKGVRI